MKLNTTKRKRFRVSNKVKKVSSNDRFRLSISRSSKNISAQIIDDLKNITKIYFDRGSYKYHGRIKIFAETLRENGMEF